MREVKLTRFTARTFSPNLARELLHTAFAGWFGAKSRAMIIAPGDDSRDDESMASPPILVFVQSCVEGRSDPGPILNVISAESAPPVEISQ